jgi:hypothetical protein
VLFFSSDGMTLSMYKHSPLLVIHKYNFVGTYRIKMNSVHRNILQTSCTYLIDNITNVEGICDYLMTDGILDTGLQDTILVIMKRKVKH